MKPSMKGVIGIVSVALVLALASCSNPDAGDAGEGTDAPYRIVAIVPVSGPLAGPVAVQTNGLQAGIDVVNADGGIGGRQVELTILDDKLDPTQAVSLLQEEVNSDTPPDAVWAGATSNETLAMLPLLSSSKIISGTTASSAKANDPASYPYHFGQQVSNAQVYGPLLDQAVADGYDDIAFVYSNDALGTDSLGHMQKAADERGLELTAEAYEPAATDLTAPMDSLKSHDPDLLIMQGYGAPVGYLFDARSKLAWDVPVIGDQAVGGTNIAAIVDESLLTDTRVQVSFVASLGDESKWLPATKSAIDLIKEKGEINQVINQALEPYDFVQLLAAAAAQAGSTDPDEMKAALENLDVPADVPWTSYQEYGYTADNHFPALTDGDMVLVAAKPMVDGQYE